MKAIICKVCGGASRYLCWTPNEHSATSVLDHYRCMACGLVFVGTPLDEQELAEAYGTLDNGTYYDIIRGTNIKKYRTACDGIGRHVKMKQAGIIDLGAGNGEFVELLLDEGCSDLSAHEISTGNLDSLTGRGVAIYQDSDYSSIPSQAFDLVTHLDVAEHVLDPWLLFSACFRILKPGGLLYFHTPVVTTLDRMTHLFHRVPLLCKIGRMWQRGRTSVFHLQIYTKASLRRLLTATGFEELNIRRRNDLSWPLTYYVHVYLCRKHGLPQWLAPALAPLLYPLIATNLLNANKAIVWARKPTRLQT